MTRCRRLTLVMLTATLLGVVACGSGATHGQLTPGVTVEVDLDGDGSPEQVCIDPADDSLTISDGEVFYRSRDKWRVAQAVLGDTDRDGLTEVVALLDSDSGRHIGLFAYFGGEYRERLVTRPIDPAPHAIEVLAEGDDTLVVIQPATYDGATERRTLLRWNGFGYTRVDTADD